MAVTYGYFDSVGGDRTYNADQMSEYFEGLVSNGVYEDVGNALIVKADTGMKVVVRSGRAIIDCKWLRNTADYQLTIRQSHTTLKRWTAVIIVLDKTNRQMIITTKDGGEAANPGKPSIASNELCLAWIYVDNNVTEITQSAITDARASGDCGWVTGLIEQVDTSQLFLQWQNAYELYYQEMSLQFTQWLDGLTARLNVNTYIESFEKNVTASSTTQYYDVTMDATGYTYESSDVVIVFINGMIATRYADYRTNVESGVLHIRVDTVINGTDIKILVLKSKIGFQTLVTSSNDDIITSAGSEIIT